MIFQDKDKQYNQILVNSCMYNHQKNNRMHISSLACIKFTQVKGNCNQLYFMCCCPNISFKSNLILQHFGQKWLCLDNYNLQDYDYFHLDTCQQYKLFVGLNLDSHNLQDYDYFHLDTCQQDKLFVGLNLDNYNLQDYDYFHLDTCQRCNIFVYSKVDLSQGQFFLILLESFQQRLQL